MIIDGMTDSFINKNKFEFMEVGEDVGNDIYLANFEYLKLILTYSVLSKQIVNEYVFRPMERMTIEGLIYDIEHEFFKFFNRIIRIELILNRINSFFANGNKWFEYLAAGKKNYDMDNLSDQIQYHMSLIILFINEN
jgi:hypothetical protein